MSNYLVNHIPLISILTANYNNSKFLKDYFESISTQTFINYEIVFVDDGSTDNSLQVVNSYRNIFKNRLVIHALESNIGFANALNCGISLCKGQYIARLDSDDIMSPNRLELQYQFLLDNSKYQIVGSNVKYFQEQLENYFGKSNFIYNESWIKNKYLKGEHGVMHGTVMFSMKCFEKHKYIQDNVPAEDYDLFSRLIKSGFSFSNIEDELTFVRIHNNSVSNYLPLTTILKTHLLKDQIFNKKTNFHLVLFKYFHFKNYRKFLYEKKKIRYLYFFISICFAPLRSLNVFLRKLGMIKYE